MNYSHQSKVTLLNTLLAPYVGAFSDHFTRGNYASITVDDYYRCFARFAHWVKQSSLNIHDINEELIEQFLNKLFPGDSSKQKVCHSRHIFHAALGHILVVLRANEVIPSASIKTTPVDKELPGKFFLGRCIGSLKCCFTIFVFHVNPVNKQHVEVNIQI